MESPPEKEEGALRDAPTPKLTRLAEDNCGQHFAQACRHEVTRVEQMPQGHTHHARVICALCRRHLCWLPRPETLERKRINSFRLAKLSMHPGLSDWERNFLRNVSKNRRLSPKQQELVVQLATRYLEGAPIPASKRDRFNKFPSFEGKRRSEPAAFGTPHSSAAQTKLKRKKPK